MYFCYTYIWVQSYLRLLELESNLKVDHYSFTASLCIQGFHLDPLPEPSESYMNGKHNCISIICCTLLSNFNRLQKY